MGHVRRGGAYYRVCDPSWGDPSDTSYAKSAGGRWNAPPHDGKPGFGALYLNRSLLAARENAHRHIRAQFGDVASLYDLLPERLPDLQHYEVEQAEFLDALTPEGVAELGLGSPFAAVPHESCRRVAEAAYEAGDNGIAALSAVEPTEEELAVFDRVVETLTRKTRRASFGSWYGPFPGPHDQ